MHAIDAMTTRLNFEAMLAEIQNDPLTALSLRTAATMLNRKDAK